MSVSPPTRECCCDLAGYPVTCGSQEALDLYNKALKSLVSGVDNFGHFCFRVLQLDNGFVLAHCTLVGRLMLMFPYYCVCIALIDSMDYASFVISRPVINLCYDLCKCMILFA